MIDLFVKRGERKGGREEVGVRRMERWKENKKAKMERKGEGKGNA